MELSNGVRVGKFDKSLADLATVATDGEFDRIIPVIDEDATRVIEHVDMDAVATG